MSFDEENVERELMWIRLTLIGIFLILLTIAMFFAKDVLLPVILGVFLALTLSPVVRTMGRLGVPAPLTAVVLVIGLGAGLGTAGYMMSGPVTKWVAQAPSYGAKIKSRLENVSRSVEAVQEASKEVDKITEQKGDGAKQKVVIEQPGILDSAVSNLFSAGATLAVALVLALFILSSNDLFYLKLVEATPKLSDKKKAVRIFHEIERSVSRYLFTITLINACLGLVIGAGLFALGFPYPYIWGALAFALNFLPYIGALSGVVLIAMFSIVTYADLAFAVLPPLLYLAATSLEGQIVTPLVVGRRLEINTVSVFLTVVFWAWLWGIAGALLAVPFLVLIKVICDNVDGLKTFGNFLSATRTTTLSE